MTHLHHRAGGCGPPRLTISVAGAGRSAPRTIRCAKGTTSRPTRHTGGSHGGKPRSAAAYRRAGDLLRYPAGLPPAGGAAGRPAGNAHEGPGVSAYGSAVNFEVSPMSGQL